jgi:mRNA interferase HigB
MCVIAKRRLREFWDLSGRGDAEQPLKAWNRVVQAVVWRRPADIKQQFRNASLVCRDRAVFNIGGNKYRIVTRINYDFGIVYIRFIGTHDQYDRIDVEKV